MSIKKIITILFLLVTLVTQAQNKAESTKSTSTYERLQETTNMHLLIGKWKNVDSPYYEIEIHFDGREIYLGSPDQFSGYHFSRKDSINISSVGVLMRWPPSYCYIMKINEQYLQLEYSSVANENPIVRSYKRVENQQNN